MDMGLIMHTPPEHLIFPLIGLNLLMVNTAICKSEGPSVKFIDTNGSLVKKLLATHLEISFPLSSFSRTYNIIVVMYEMLLRISVG